MKNSLLPLSGVRRNSLLSSACLLSFVFILSLGLPPRLAVSQTDEVAGRLIQFNDNGAWSWFEEERAIVDEANGLVLVSSCSDNSGALARVGNVDVAQFQTNTGIAKRFTLNSGMQSDDHNSAGLLLMNDGRYLAAYSNHGTDQLTRSRTSILPGAALAWNPEITRNNGAGTTYNNVFQLSSEGGRIYNFTRTVGFDPNVNFSDDLGATWTYGARLLSGPGRPYVNYTSNHIDTIHFVNTEQHPRDFDNSVYHAFIQNGQVFDSFGNLLDNLDTVGMSPTAGTKIYAGDADHVAWVSDIELDEFGNPTVAFTVQVGDSGLPVGQGGQDLRYNYARFDGTAWNVNEIAFAGSRLYSGEDDYTGNISIDPNNVNEVYISTNANPVTGANLISSADGNRHYEIFRGTTLDGGANWTWESVTTNSTEDNLRPIVPAWNGDDVAVLWMRGTYTTYLNYDCAVVGVVDLADEISGPIQYTDADLTNTVRADGQAFNPTSGSGQGATDDRWHIRSGFGNQNGVFTCDEQQDEDVPPLVTTISNDGDAGNFDVYVYFWSNKFDQWEIQAGFSSAAMTNFRKQSSEHAQPGEFSNAVIVNSSSNNEYMYQAYLGRVTLEAGETIELHIQDGPGAERTWYDGVGIASTTGDGPPPSAGPVVYLDASPANTTTADGSPLVEGVHYSSSSNTGDDRWNYRSFANGGTVFGSNDGGEEDAPRLRTTVENLEAGNRYKVYAYFWGAENALWRGRAGLVNATGDLPGYNTSHFTGSAFSPMTFVTLNSPDSDLNPGPLSTSNGGNPAFENGNYFDNQVMTEEGNRSLFEVFLGEIVADAEGSIQVFIDDLANTPQGNRTWFDGVGVQLVEQALPVVIPPDSAAVTRGTFVAGTASDLAESDNVDFSGRRGSSDVQSRVFVEVQGTSHTDEPLDLSFTLEASVFARSQVNQSIDMFDFELQDWETIDTRAAARFSDSTTEIELSGDLARFVEAGTGQLLVRVRFVSANQRQSFSANMDQTIWVVR